MRPTVEITIPILNEEVTLDTQVRKLRQYIERDFDDFASITIVLADNGSNDATPLIASSLANELGGIKYLRLEERGVGRALKASWGGSTAEIVGYMDLDLATDLQHLRPALEKLRSDEADIVTGSRLGKGSLVIGRSPLRNFTSRCFNLILKAWFDISFSDGMCGFKFLKRRRLENLISAGACSDGWFFATEILIAGEYLGYRINDMPVKWTDDPNSKVKIAKLSLEYLKGMQVLKHRLPEKRRTL
jgi:glycosyltransferase involved in cell wall biosynthesis